MESTAFSDAAWNALPSIGMLWAMLHRIKCIQSSWMESTAFNRDAFYHAAWNILHSITLHGIHCIQLGSIAPRCMESNAFNLNPWFFSFSFFFFFFFIFLFLSFFYFFGPLPRHMEVPRLGVESEL